MMMRLLVGQDAQRFAHLVPSLRRYPWMMNRSNNRVVPLWMYVEESSGVRNMVEILQHPAVEGFLTHCGWNSVLEAMVAGVPLITWPLYSDQFYNEKLVELLGIGVGVGADVWNSNVEIISPIIRKNNIKEGILRILTDESAVAESIRSRSKEVSLMAKRAVEEGGSSFNSLTTLIEELKAIKVAPKSTPS
ncbi:hypothetical protein OSB04_013892 [Centaurea solstitialis]|uniref:Uncharacterized protein n=1 Tax=Centaurea solstitialis TaxID=347529 RepID=A0AA38TLN0_9ASTR|nr:hypothetical protein OSB04_013892 [Centaurea solstitialis]